MLTTSIGEWIVFSLIYKSARYCYNNDSYYNNSICNSPRASFTDPEAWIAVHNTFTDDNGKIIPQRQNTQETIIFDKAFVGLIYNVSFADICFQCLDTARLRLWIGGDDLFLSAMRKLSYLLNYYYHYHVYKTKMKTNRPRYLPR